MKQPINVLPTYRTKYVAKTGDVWEFGHWFQQKKEPVGHAFSMEDAMLAYEMSTVVNEDRRPAWRK